MQIANVICMRGWVQIANLENAGKAGNSLQKWKKVEKIGKKWKSGDGVVSRT